MKITNVIVNKLKNNESAMKGVASILIDDCLAMHDIRIIENDKKIIIAMPSRKKATGGYKDVVHPINSETRKLFEDAILKEYYK